MAQYKVRSGQNIYDIALALYGSVEGIFPLLAQNEWLTLETELDHTMSIDYSEDLAINKDITIWLKENGVNVKNGDHFQDFIDVESLIQNHFEAFHQDVLEELKPLSPDEQAMFWETLHMPKMIIRQQGQLCSFKVELNGDSHLVIDWGDYSEPLITEGHGLQEIEHCYKGSGEHSIVLYGDFTCEVLDFSGLNGLYYPLGYIYANQLITPIESEELNKLIIPQK